MTISDERRSLVDCREPLAQARELLLDTSKNCVDRVCDVWPILQDFPTAVLPASLRAMWTSACDRAARLREVVAEPYESIHVEEAGDIGSILLCMEMLLRSDLMSGGFFFDAIQQNGPWSIPRQIQRQS